MDFILDEYMGRLKEAAEALKMSKGCYAYQTLTKIDPTKCDKVRTCHSSGRGRFTTCLDYTADFRRLLDAAGIRYEHGNDAPRGGKCGQYIIINPQL